MRFQIIRSYTIAIRQYLNAAFDTDGNSLLKRHIQLAAFIYTIGLFIQTTLYTQTLSSRLPVTVTLIILASIPVLLGGLYLLVVKQKHWLAIYILVIYLIIKQNVSVAMSFGFNITDFTMLNSAWIHVVAFGIVIILGVKKSIVPITVYSSSIILQIYLGLDGRSDDIWDTSRFYEFVLIHGLVLFFAYINEWSTAKAFRERDQAREQEEKSAEKYTQHIERLLDNKKQLLVDVSHELRTPLSILKANIEAMEDGINKHEDSYPVLHRKLHQIDRLIQDIYFISKSDIQELTLYIDKIIISDLVDEVMSSFCPLAEEKSLAFSMINSLTSDDANDITIEGDWQRLIQLFSNLIQNSIDYTDRDGQINLLTRAEGSGIEFTVQDSVPGVPEQEQPQLFERLYRKESSRNRATGGSGLGLSICKAIVEAHHGTITIASSPLGGLAITSWFPLTQPTKD